MSYVLELQGSGSSAGDRMWSTWSLVGCMSTFSVGAC